MLDEAPIGDTNVVASATMAADEKIIELVLAVATEWPDKTFAARVLVRFVGAIGERLPAQQRLAIARCLLTEAARLGFLWN
jgi:hypothetical protein